MPTLQANAPSHQSMLHPQPLLTLSVRLRNRESGPGGGVVPELTVYLQDASGENVLDKTWDELMSLAVPALVTAGARQVQLRRDEIESLERAGWLLLVEWGHYPTEWRNA